MIVLGSTDSFCSVSGGSYLIRYDLHVTRERLSIVKLVNCGSRGGRVSYWYDIGDRTRSLDCQVIAHVSRYPLLDVHD